MNSPRRPPGRLQHDILAALTGHDLTVKGILRSVGRTNEGAILQALRKLEAAGHVEVVDANPMVWRLVTAPAPSAAPSTPNTVVPIVRPGGQLYHPRRLAGGSDVEVLQRLREQQIPVLLYGPPGTGKTSLVEAAFGEVITIAGDGDTSTGDLIGEYTQDPGGGFVFVYGPLVQAMETGAVLFVDDATLISPGVLAALYPAMDGRGQIAVKAHTGEIVTASSGFYVIAGHNPGVAGAHLSEALASRFAVHIEVTTDLDLARSLGVPGEALKIAAHLATRLSTGDVGWAPQLRELLATKHITDTLGLDVALANLIAIAPDIDRDTVAGVVKGVTGRTITPLTLGPQLS